MERWKKPLERSPNWRSEFRCLFPVYQQHWDNLQNATRAKYSPSGSIEVKSFKQLAFSGLRHGFQNMENFMSPRAGLFFPWCVTWSPFPLNLEKPSRGFSASHFCLGGCWLRTELHGVGKEFLGEMVRAWVFCALHKYGLSKSKTWQIKKAGALLLQPTSASRLGASELGGRPGGRPGGRITGLQLRELFSRISFRDPENFIPGFMH